MSKNRFDLDPGALALQDFLQTAKLISKQHARYSCLSGVTGPIPFLRYS